MPSLSFFRQSSRLRLAATIAFFIGLALIISASPSGSTASFTAGQLNSNQKRTHPEFVPGDILVRYRDDRVANLKTRASTLLAQGRQMRVQVERFEGSDVVPGLRVARVAPEDTLAAIEELKKQPDVLYAEPNYLLHLDLTPNDPRFTNNDLYGMVKIGAPTAWDTTTGSSTVVVGVIDEGIDTSHPDLAANIWANPGEAAAPNGVDDDNNGFIDDINGYNFASNSGTIPAELHATHVAGTIGAVGNNSTGVVGVNWNVRLMSLRFIDGTSGDTLDAIRACSYAKMMKDRWVASGGSTGANIKVLNNSYGGGGFTQSFLDVINSLKESGVVFVAAAGNVDNPGEEPDNDLVPQYPAGYEASNVISVASTNQSDGLAGSSHFGATSVDLGAPGVGIVSTSPGNNYTFLSGTSMATPHVAGSAALLFAANSNLSADKVKSLLIFNGDSVPALSGKTLTGRRLNVGSSFQELALNDTTVPGTVSGPFRIIGQSGRNITLAWTASGDNGSSGQASLYTITFTDAVTGAIIPLASFAPPPSGTPQTLAIKIPYRHTKGTIKLQEFDNSGNEGVPATLNVTVNLLEGDPYAIALGAPAALTTGGTPLNLIGDDKLRLNHSLGITFPFFGQNFTTVNVSTNGNLFFSTPPTRSNGDADDVPSSAVELSKFKMISAMWDDVRTDSTGHVGTACSGCDVFMVSPDSTRVIFRWKGVTFGAGTVGTEFPVNFEIELRNDGIIKSRYGTGQSSPINTHLFPVVGISAGEPDPYVVTALTSETTITNLTNAMSVTYLPRALSNPIDNIDFFVDQHYEDFLNREPDAPGIGFWTNEIINCGTNAGCIDNRRVHVSAAFYLSIEFQETGFMVYRFYKAAFGNLPNNAPVPIRFEEFLPDTQQIGDGVQVGTDPDWEAKLEANIQAFAAAFVARARFLTDYPTSMSPTAFVDQLFSRAGVTPSASDRSAAIAEFGGAGNTADAAARARAVRRVADNSILKAQEKNRAFVLMQYFGYLRRNPYDPPEATLDYTGYNFWLTKLLNHGGDFVSAEMVRSFLLSGEYRHRFGL